MKLPELPGIKGIFITGTDTDVGKTWVATGLTAALRQDAGLRRFISNRSRAAAPGKGGD